MRAMLKLAGIALAVVVSTGAVSAIAQDSSPDVSKSRQDPNRLICRSMPVIGSLAKRERRCYTRAEWERFAQGARKQTEQLQGTLPSGQIAN